MRRLRYFRVMLAALLLGAGVGVGCLATAPRAVEPSELSGPYRVQVYRGGQLVKEVALEPKLADQRAVAAWLASHRDGWRPSLVSYAPGRVLRGNGFNLNLLADGLCVLNYGLPDHPRQVVRHVAAADAEALVAATGGE